MGWRRSRTRETRKEAATRPNTPEAARHEERARPGPIDWDVLREALRPGPANTGRCAALLQAGQQTLGNHALQGLLRARGLQAKLTVSQPGDAYEQEADRVAEAVSGVPAAAPQRQDCAPEAAAGGSGAASAMEVTPQIESHINSLRGGGFPLPGPVRGFLEPRMGADFGAVRLHTGDRADEAARSVQARAFTVGRDIIFAAGQYAPDTVAGRMGDRVSRAPADGPQGPVPGAATLKEQEALTKALVAALQGKKPEEKDQGSEAVKKVLEAFLETPAGKKLKKQALSFAFSSKGLPFTLLVGSAALAAMVANNTSIPSVPDIPLAKDVTLQVGFKGTLQKMTGMTIGLKFTFGGTGERTEKPAAQAAELPAWSPGQKIPADMLHKWLIGVAFQEYELAGPDEEEDRRKFYLKLQEDPETVPDARLLAEALGRQILAKGAQREKRVDFELKYEDLWKEAYRLFERSKGFRPGLVARLRFLLDAVVAELPESARGVEQVTFACAGRLIPLSVTKEPGK